MTQTKKLIETLKLYRAKRWSMLMADSLDVAIHEMNSGVTRQILRQPCVPRD